MDDVLIIGSGPAGLSCAAEVIRRGVPATVLERGPDIGAAWAARYDSLRFNTSRLHSALPGAPFPRQWGQFPTRDHYVGYLQEYAERHRVPVRAGVEVATVEAAEGGWRLQTNVGDRHTHQLVVATGAWNRPVWPAWARDPMFRGRVLHSCDYRNAEPFVGQDIVVVGAGSTGMELAHEMACGGARSVSLSVRTPPNILLRVMGGAPSDLPVPLLLHLPAPLVDRMLSGLQRRCVGDLSAYGLPAPVEGPMASLKSRGAGTAVVDREVIDGIREGLVHVVSEVKALDVDGAVLVDGQHVKADTVVVATGFSTGLDRLVGHLGVLDERQRPRDVAGREVLPGLRFLGYVYRPGLTGYVGRQARRVGREIVAREKASRRARVGLRPPASQTPTSRDRAGSRG